MARAFRSPNSQTFFDRFTGLPLHAIVSLVGLGWGLRLRTASRDCTAAESVPSTRRAVDSKSCFNSPPQNSFPRYPKTRGEKGLEHHPGVASEKTLASSGLSIMTAVLSDIAVCVKSALLGPR